jgi:hypothetical protein
VIAIQLPEALLQAGSLLLGRQFLEAAREPPTPIREAFGGVSLEFLQRHVTVLVGIGLP